MPIAKATKTHALWLLAALTTALTGCQSLSPAQCASADWSELGRQDGARGSTDRAASYIDSCSKVGISVDVSTYRASRSHGLQSYCRPANALSEGLAGRGYAGVCPEPLDQSFRSVYGVARRAHNAEQAVAYLQHQQDGLQAELVRSTTNQERKTVLRELLGRLDRQLHGARQVQRSAQTQLEHMRQDMQQRGAF